MGKPTTQEKLDLQETSKPSSPVECLGLSFESEEARRDHFLAILREKLEDPEFRKIEGFPAGSKEKILELSDPPYYTACPNPFVSEFISHVGRIFEPAAAFRQEPYAADVSEGKNDAIYSAHSYHTKVPYKAIIRYLLHYTTPGDMVFDGFCGTGMTGVAAQLCGDRATIESLGFKVLEDGGVLEKQLQDGQESWVRISKLGARYTILSDLSPFATFVAANYNDFQKDRFGSSDVVNTLNSLETSLSPLYTTINPDTKEQGRAEFYVWSEVFACASCGHVDTLFRYAVDKETNQLKDNFPCPSCKGKASKKSLEKVWTSAMDLDGKAVLRESKTELVEVYGRFSDGTHRYPPTADDVIAFNEALRAKREWFPDAEFPHGRQTRKIRVGAGLSKVHQLFTPRALTVISKLWFATSKARSLSNRKALRFLISACLTILSRRERFREGTGKGAQSGTLYVPSLQIEKNPFSVLRRKREGLAATNLATNASMSIVTCQSHGDLSNVPDDSIDYIFTDPPFGESLQYGELNFFHEAWLGVISVMEEDCVLNYVHHKDLNFYRDLMRKSFGECFRVLRPGRWMTVEFSNTQASTWNAIQTALQDAGFVVANVSALDKQQGSFNSVTTTTSVKQDLVISAYKPNGGLEERFAKAGGGEAGVWDFVKTHLGYLPDVKVKAGRLAFVPERDPRIIYDRLVAFFVVHGFPLPLSAQEFQNGLAQRFIERDGMYFLPNQAANYDKAKMRMPAAPQAELFVADERSAIDWLRQFLKERPSTYQDIQPEFMAQLGAGWKKHEVQPELLELLRESFIEYDGKGEVPGQIHSYLSTQFKNLRNLDKAAPALVQKAVGRWYAPDPNKAPDLEKIRERGLLKEFETYRNSTQRKLRSFRLEAVRTGFKKALQEKRFQDILDVAEKLPEDVLQEDELLVMWYDRARLATR